MPSIMDNFVEWLDTVDCPPLTTAQKVLLGFLVAVMLLVVVTSVTGHAYLAAIACLRAVDGLSIVVLTSISIAVVAALEAVGVNTTLLALAVGYIYGRSMDTVLMATVVSSAVTWGAVVLGCLVAYVMGATCYKEWSRELQRRNRVFEALDTVLQRKGLTVNLMLRLVIPDLIINFAMATSSCSFLNFVLGFAGLMPWIIVYCYYGVTIENLTSISKGGEDEDGETAELVVGIVVTTVLALVIAWYTKKALEDMIAEAETGGNDSESGGGQGEHVEMQTTTRQPTRSRNAPRVFSYRHAVLS